MIEFRGDFEVVVVMFVLFYVIVDVECFVIFGMRVFERFFVSVRVVVNF